MPEAHEPIEPHHARGAHRRREAPGQARLQPGPEPLVVRLLQLRHLVLDHLDPGRLLHELRRRLQQRRPDLDLLVVADPRPFILLIGFTMSELVSAYPTSGGIYWWASKLGGPAAGFFTGWLNLIGLVAVTAGVSYGCATFIDLTISTFSDVLRRRLLADPGLHHLRGRAGARARAEHLQQPPDGDHEQRLGVVARRRRRGDRADPDPRPRPAPVVQLRVHRAVQQLGLRRRRHEHLRVLVRDRAVRLPADAVHDHRLRRVARTCPRRPRRRRRQRPRASGGRSSTRCSVATSCCCACVFAIPNDADGNPDNAGVGGGGVAYIFVESLGTNWATFVLFISASAQFFCATSCMTSASRMTFAFSRDGAIPGSKTLQKLNAKQGAGQRRHLRRRVQRDRHAARADRGRRQRRAGARSRSTPSPRSRSIGLYLAFAIPIYLRWRHGDKFEVGSWNNGSKYKWMNPIAVAEIVIVSLYLMMPFDARLRTRSATTSSGSS